jgi:hypothetical protein
MTDLQSIYNQSLAGTSPLLRLVLERKTKPRADQILLVADDPMSPLCNVVRCERINLESKCCVSVVVPRVAVQVYCVGNGEVMQCQNQS